MGYLNQCTLCGNIHPSDRSCDDWANRFYLNSDNTVLDKGFVRLVDIMGNDTSIVEAARVSYGGGTKTPEQDEKLIAYLMKHEHWSPFEMCEYKVHVKAPIFVERQWFRHRIGSFNSISGRYVELKEEFYIPAFFRKQSKSNKQGSSGMLDPDHDTKFVGGYTAMCNNAFQCYELLLEAGVAKEMARMVLPVSTYTEFYWKVNLRSLFNFLKLRLDEHAQQEIRDYAIVLQKIVAQNNPIAWRFFAEYHLNRP